MADTDKERDREIAQNEAERQATGDIRVSGWAMAFTVIIVAIVAGIVVAWRSH